MADGRVYAGTAFVQAQHRVNVARCCRENGISIGDQVRVWIEAVKEDEYDEQPVSDKGG